MITLRAIRNRHFHNDPFTLLISSNSSKFTNLSSIPHRPFSRSAQSSPAAADDEKIRSFTAPFSGFLKKIFFGEEKADATNRAAAEKAEIISEERNVEEKAEGISEERSEFRDLSSERGETVKNVESSIKKLGLSALFTDKEKGESDSMAAPVKEKRILSALFRGEKKGEKSRSKPKSKPAPAAVQTAEGAEDPTPTVGIELSSDVKMFAEHLYAKGYLKDANFMPKHRFDPACLESRYARGFLKFAAVRFGDDHLDIVRSLSAGDLKKVALFGCPSLEKRSVVAAKIIRSFLEIEESKVCQACTLKESCNHRNSTRKIHASKINLAIVMKVLIMYATDSVPSELVVPEDVKISVSRLLKEITSLSQEMP